MFGGIFLPLKQLTQLLCVFLTSYQEDFVSFYQFSQNAPVVMFFWFVYILDFLGKGMGDLGHTIDAKICHVLYILQGKAVLRLSCQNISNELVYHSYPSLVITVQGVVGTRNCIFNSKWKREDTENWSLRSM